MNARAVVFPMANPTPDVDPVKARQYAEIVASGIIHIYLKDFAKQLTTFRTSGGSLGDQAGALERVPVQDLPVQAQVLGFKLEVTPQDSALNVTWTTLSTDLPLSSFLRTFVLLRCAIVFSFSPSHILTFSREHASPLFSP